MAGISDFDDEDENEDGEEAQQEDGEGWHEGDHGRQDVGPDDGEGKESLAPDAQAGPSDYWRREASPDLVPSAQSIPHWRELSQEPWPSDLEDSNADVWANTDVRGSNVSAWDDGDHRQSPISAYPAQGALGGVDLSTPNNELEGMDEDQREYVRRMALLKSQPSVASPAQSEDSRDKGAPSFEFDSSRSPSLADGRFGKSDGAAVGEEEFGSHGVHLQRVSAVSCTLTPFWSYADDRTTLHQLHQAPRQGP